ncbi:hypothetical protein BG015_000531 [Linnemannia schmuckeri]|uniref:Uncharacterized protein n=1 Tax=Linnemannia schmuckeri TaxID=64567 RepID=A0A9P5RTE4_9FUNG|nr:hypothetical protein BG015_000531 [Linnemannia schmuckeri]
MAESAPSPAPAIDWADDTDDEIDFGAPVFSDDDELAPELAKIQADSNYGASKPASPPTATNSSYSSSSGQQRDRDSSSPRYTAGFNDGSNRSLDRRSQNDSSLQTMSSRSSRGRDYPPSYRDSPDSHHPSSFSSPKGSTPFDRDSRDRFNNKSGLPPPRRGESDFGGDGRGSSFGSPQSDSSTRWGSRNNDDRGSTGQQRPARQIIPLPPKPSVTPDRPHMDRSRSPSYRSRSPLPGISADRLRDRPIQSSNSNHSQNHHHQQQRTQSPYMDQGRSLSPSSAHQQGRSFSPVRQHHPRTYMDQVIRANEQQSRRRSRDMPSSDGGGRWEKTPHEDKPYPTLPPPSPAHVASHSHSPKDKDKDKDDTVYFLRREGRNNNSGSTGNNIQQSEPLWTSDLRREGRNNSSNSSNNSNNGNNIQQSEAIWTSDLRKNAGTMYHEREKLSASNNSSRNPGSNVSKGSNDRWEKATLHEPDLPYPERSSPSNHHHNNNTNHDGRAKHSRTQSRGHSDNFPVSPSTPVEKTSTRGTRGGKGKEQKRRSKDQLLHGTGAGNDDTQQDDKDDGSGVPWWEQSTYGAKKKEELMAVPKEAPKPAVTLKETTKPSAATKESLKPATTLKESSKPANPTPAPKSSAKSTPAPAASEPNEEKPWWEQSTYGVKSKTTTATNNSTTMKSTSQGGGAGQSAADTMARRKALGEKTLTSGVEALTLVSRGDDDSTGIKNRSVQDRVFAEIKAMIARYEDRYGTDKMKPIPPRTRQSEEMDTILESFRKLREGLFATEARDLFSVEVYEESVLNSLYAGNIPELTKALHHLVQELHPVVYKLSPHSSPNECDNKDGTLTSFAQIPARRQTFLGLYILHHIAKSSRQSSAVALTEDPLFQTVNHPKTGTDELVASFLYLFPLHPQKKDNGRLAGLQPDLRLALEYWTYLRQGNWIGRERLLGTDRALAGNLPITWAQRLMIRHSMGDSLGTARGLSVATMHKAYYSLPVSVMAQRVGMVEEGERKEFEGVEGVSERWIEGLKGKYGLVGGVVVRDGVFMFKAKS